MMSVHAWQFDMKNHHTCLVKKTLGSSQSTSKDINFSLHHEVERPDKRTQPQVPMQIMATCEVHTACPTRGTHFCATHENYLTAHRDTMQ